MIIKREYVKFNDLILANDEGGEMFCRAMDEVLQSLEPTKKAEMYLWLGEACFCFRDMSWSLDMREMLEGFERLDKEQPFDNGFTYADVTEAKVFPEYEDLLFLFTTKNGRRQVVKVLNI